MEGGIGEEEGRSRVGIGRVRGKGVGEEDLGASLLFKMPPPCHSTYFAVWAASDAFSLAMSVLLTLLVLGATVKGAATGLVIGCFAMCNPVGSAC